MLQCEVVLLSILPVNVPHYASYTEVNVETSCIIAYYFTGQTKLTLVCKIIC